MTPAARVAAAIEVLDGVIAAARTEGPPADRLLTDWLRQRRFAGSKDRRAIRDLVYRAIRVCGPVPQDGRAALLRLAEEQPDLLTLFDGSSYGPTPVQAGDVVASGGVAPAWLVERLAASGIADEEAHALLARAPLDIRVNALKAQRDTLDLPEPGEPLPASHGVRYPADTAVQGWAAYDDGTIEVQDGGSQLVCEAAGAQPGETVIDLCAGAGGKTLALAAAMGNKGTLVASDTDRARLGRLAPRADRAGAMVHHTVLLNPGQESVALEPWRTAADLVLVDAPCSGTGTWRRNPEARWRLTPDGLARLTTLQARLLRLAAGLLRPGGRLVYVTCSLLDEEGAEQVATFLADHAGWKAEALSLPAGVPHGPGWRLTPHTAGTDGFFVARLVKR